MSERERERACVWFGVCVCERERERVCVCVRERVTEKETTTKIPKSLAQNHTVSESFVGLHFNCSLFSTLQTSNEVLVLLLVVA